MALLTLVVIAGLVTTELVVVVRGDLNPLRMIPTWMIQSRVIGLFSKAYFG